MTISEDIFQDLLSGKFDTFYAQAYPSLIIYASRQLGTDFSFLAEDCVQDSIYKMYDMRENFSDAHHFKTYLYASIHNKAVSYLRKNNSMQNYLSQQTEQNEDLQASIIEQETLDMLYDAIDQLPENLHKVFEMSFEEGLRNEEIAQRLSISTSAVKKRKAKIISTLRSNLSESQLLLLLALYTIQR